MCNINVIFKKNKKENEVVSNVMNVLSYRSFLSNDDGEGFIGLNDNGVTICKSVKKIRFKDDFWFLSSHQRLSTSGKNDTNNTHPHETKNLIIQHNGIFTNLGDKEKSDTKEFVDLLEEEYVKHKHNIVKTIQSITKKVGGSYSIILYEKSTKKVFYFKNYTTFMYHLQNKDWLIMSTSKENVEYAKWYLKINGTIKDTKECIIFDVLGGLQTKGTFKEKETDFVVQNKSDCREKWYNNNTYNDMGGYTNMVADCVKGDYSAKYFEEKEKYCDDYMKANRMAISDIEKDEKRIMDITNNDEMLVDALNNEQFMNNLSETDKKTLKKIMIETEKNENLKEENFIKENFEDKMLESMTIKERREYLRYIFSLEQNKIKKETERLNDYVTIEEQRPKTEVDIILDKSWENEKKFFKNTYMF